MPTPGSFTLSLHDLIEVPRGRHLVRVAVISQQLRAAGTAHLPAIDVPGLAGRLLAIGGLVLGAEGEPSPAVRIARLGASKANALPFPPTTRREFAPTERLRVFARVFATAGAQVQLTLERDGEIVRTVTPQTTSSAGSNGALDCQAVLTLAGLPAGVYTLELTAEAGRERALREVGFTVR